MHGLRNRDLQIVIEKSHAIKGVAGNLSAMRLMKSAAELEADAKAGDMETVQSKVKEFKDTFEETISALNETA